MNSTKNEKKQTNSTEKPDDSGVRAGPPQFVQRRLTDEEMAEAKRAILPTEDILQIVSELALAGYKCSISRDNYGGGFQAFLTPMVPGDPNFGWTLTSRAPDLISAMSVLLWKHFKLYGTIWPRDRGTLKGESWG